MVTKRGEGNSCIFARDSTSGCIKFSLLPLSKKARSSTPFTETVAVDLSKHSGSILYRSKFFLCSSHRSRRIGGWTTANSCVMSFLVTVGARSLSGGAPRTSVSYSHKGKFRSIVRRSRNKLSCRIRVIHAIILRMHKREILKRKIRWRNSSTCWEESIP